MYPLYLDIEIPLYMSKDDSSALNVVCMDLSCWAEDEGQHKGKIEGASLLLISGLPSMLICSLSYLHLILGPVILDNRRFIRLLRLLHAVQTDCISHLYLCAAEFVQAQKYACPPDERGKTNKHKQHHDFDARRHQAISITSLARTPRLRQLNPSHSFGIPFYVLDTYSSAV